MVALVRHGSESKLATGATAVCGNALDQSTFQDHIYPAQTFIQLVGVPHPSPAKAEQFKSVDLLSVRASVKAAVAADIQHFVYVSVAHPAPVMKSYIAVRSEGEALIRSAGLNATILRPWYVLGPGHQWPALLLPIYWILEQLPPTRESARRLGLVSIGHMLNALINAVEDSPKGVVIREVPDIRQSSTPKLLAA